jgi:ElaB/YqjD/DUF883 family membrane-anchored ribosome-binding protein
MNTQAKTLDSGHTPANGATHSEISNLIADIEEVLGKAAHVVDVDVSKLRDSLRHKLAAAKAGLTEGGRKLTRAASSTATATDDYVHASPWQAMGIAAVAGVAVGYLLARR